jgi:rhodanese-related sulfurtransferase
MRLFLALLMLCAGATLVAAEKEVKKVMINADLYSVEVMHKGQKVTLMRNQNPDNKIDARYQRTNQGTIQPMHPFAPHAVETIGEQEMIDYLVRFSKGDSSLIIVDSRTPDWVEHGTIPGAINIPFTEFNDNEKLLTLMEKQFGATISDITDYSTAKTVVMFCNGIWCGQSPTAIRKLLSVGYPAAKIKYFRGGMQNWQSLGLTVVKP